MRTYYDIREAFGNVLPAKLAKPAAMQMKAYVGWFTDTFQNVVVSRNTSDITLAELLDAINNSELQFKQYPASKAAVKEIAYSLFVADGWLKKAPVVAELPKGSGYYIVGGRHRGYAIAAAIAQLCHINAQTEEDAEAMFEMMMTDTILVESLIVPNNDTLVKLIEADNDSRTMRGAELAHIKTQMMGLDADNTEDIADLAVDNENLTKKETNSMVAQMFTRNTHPKIKPQTLQTIGEKVAAYAVYGISPGMRLGRKDESVRSPEDVALMMTKAYSIFVALVKDVKVVARNANSIVERIISHLENNDTYEPMTDAESLTSEQPKAKVNLELNASVEDIF